MYAQIKPLFLCVLVGPSALAAPQHHRHQHGRKPCNPTTYEEVVTYSVVTTFVESTTEAYLTTKVTPTPEETEEMTSAAPYPTTTTTTIMAPEETEEMTAAAVYPTTTTITAPDETQEMTAAAPYPTTTTTTTIMAPEETQEMTAAAPYSTTTTTTIMAPEETEEMTAAAVYPTTTTITAPDETQEMTAAAVYPTTTAKTTPEETQEITTAAAPTVTAASSSSSSGVDYMTTVNKWRGIMNLPTLTYNAAIEASCMQTLINNGKNALTEASHMLSNGAMAQVLATGTWTTDGFAKAYVQEWLCEIPSLHGLSGVCNNPAGSSEQGHAKILTSKSYTTIGCAGFDGNVGCSLGF
ncbi:Uu.00g022830.m01.CDS01 [Anthostomella pinea]|uniref:Uu.00g022830.m01.CDS01 n=1 Tax=Anthostomella pinea TaxID=933095 RepID=A0AAI8YQW3_9PEZI|nr:Uu.00g022830.m01.CDS01 [Anthostomella pinea]